MLPEELRAGIQMEVDKMPSGKGLSRGTAQQPCWWLAEKVGKCKHYQHAPRVCVDFEFGSGKCLWFRSKVKS